MKRHKLKYPMPKLTPMRELAELALEGAEYREWYGEARKEIGRAAIAMIDGNMELHKRVDQLAALLALFSPRTSVTRSCKFAVHYMRTAEFLPACLGDIRRSVKHWDLTGEIRGPKTEPFYRALMGDSSACVLDVWMGQALGIDPKRFHDSKTVYAVCSERIKETAEYRGWTVAETQAAIWSATVLQNRAAVPALSLMPLIDGIPI